MRANKVMSSDVEPNSAQNLATANLGSNPPLAAPQGTAHRPGVRLNGLDGVRALAALAVVGYHLLPTWIPGGYLGVDVFFVLSGFLITSLLVKERIQTGKISLRRFWARRFRRLFPAIFTTVIVCTGASVLVARDLLVGLRHQFLSSLTFTYNWVSCYQGSSYFDRNSPQIFRNMWSLAVEQQFYLIWPLLMVLLVWRIKPAKRYLLPVFLAIASALAMFILLHLGAGLTRVYQGTDTHAMGLMLGSALALLFPWALADRHPRMERTAARTWGWLGWVGLAGVLTMFFTVHDRSTFAYPWSLLVASLFTMLTTQSMLAEVTSQGGPGRWLSNLLSCRLLRWLGDRSYSLYLWHWPLYVLIVTLFPHKHYAFVAGSIVILSILMADLTYRYVETPMRKNGIFATIKSWFNTRKFLNETDSEALVNSKQSSASALDTSLPLANTSPADLLNAELPPVNAKFKLRPQLILLYAFTTFALVLTPMALWNPPTKTSSQLVVEQGQALLNKHIQAEKSKSKSSNPAPSASTATNPDNSSNGGSAQSDSKKSGQKDGTSQPGASNQTNPQQPKQPATKPVKQPNLPDPTAPQMVTVVGDSVTVAASPALTSVLPDVDISAEVSRSSKRGIGIVRQMKANGQLRPYLVFALATNGFFTVEQGEQLLEAVGSNTKVVLVTGFGPAVDTWINDSNNAILELAKRHPQQVQVANWNAAISPHTDLLAGDNVHPGPEGGRIFANTVVQALKSFRN